MRNLKNSTKKKDLDLIKIFKRIAKQNFMQL